MKITDDMIEEIESQSLLGLIFEGILATLFLFAFWALVVMVWAL